MKNQSRIDKKMSTAKEVLSVKKKNHSEDLLEIWGDLVQRGTEHHSTVYARYLCVGHCRSQHSAYNVWSGIQRIRSEYRAHHVQNVRIHRQCAYRKNTNVHSIQQLDRQWLGFIANSALNGNAVGRFRYPLLLLNFSEFIGPPFFDAEMQNHLTSELRMKSFLDIACMIKCRWTNNYEMQASEKSKIAASNVFGQKSAPKSTWNALHVNVLAKKYNNLLDLYSVFPFQ